MAISYDILDTFFKRGSTSIFGTTNELLERLSSWEGGKLKELNNIFYYFYYWRKTSSK